ncbi:MerR family transcriptional regulator, partial [Enterococcus faecium]
DALRNWELNGLLTLKRSQNGYRIYEIDDLNRLKIIRILRSANYSLEAILRLLNSLDQSQEPDIKSVLNQPDPDEDIISVCDRLIASLEKAKENALGLTA